MEIGGKSVKRLTEKHVKKSDGHYMKCSEHCQNETLQCGECDELDRFVDRLGSIEDILGDDYDLDRLRELVETAKNIPHVCRFCVGCEMEPKDGHGCDEYDSFVLSTRRLRDLVDAEGNGRCIVFPRKLFVGQKIWVIEPESRTGQEKQAWVNTVKGFGHGEIFYQHGGCPVYSETFDNIGKTIFLNCEDAEAALKGEQDG